MANNIIDSSTPGIVIKELPIHLTDEKLKSILLKTYEMAQRDSAKPKYYKSYSILFSISGTLLLSVLTSSYKSIGTLDSNTITIIVWIILVGCAITGFVFLGITTNKKLSNDTTDRDTAINKVFSDYCQKP